MVIKYNVYAGYRLHDEDDEEVERRPDYGRVRIYSPTSLSLPEHLSSSASVWIVPGTHSPT